MKSLRHALPVALGLLAGLTGGTDLAAQTIPSPFAFVEERHSVGLYAGPMVTDRGSVGQGPHSGPIVGARYAIRFTGPLSGEVGLATSPTQRTILTRATLAAEPTPIEDTRMVLLLADAGLRFHLTGPRTWHGLAPYVAAMGGAALNLTGRPALEEAIPVEQRVTFGPSFAVGGGVGTDWFLTERLALRAEVRDYLWRLTVPEGLSPTGRRDTEWTHNFAFTLGAALHF
jgi:hypothetical protein